MFECISTSFGVFLCILSYIDVHEVLFIWRLICVSCRVTGGELFEDIVAREFYSEADAR